MARFFDELSSAHRAFIAEQKLFFTATAPRSGRINLSPKGMDSFRVLTPRRVAYLDFTGSGNETAAHLADDGRITILFCAFVGEPSILRLYGRGHVVHFQDTDWTQLRPLFGPTRPGERQLIVVEVDSVLTSCGFAVPFFDYVGEREVLLDWADKKGSAGLAAYRAERNTRSIDNLPTFLPTP